MATTGLKTYTSKGNAVPVLTRRGTVNVGVKLDNGFVYVRPRQRFDEGIGGSGVRVTNSMWAKRNQRTQSLGMGAVGQQNRYLG